MGLPGWTALIVGMTSLDLNGIPAPAPGQKFVDGRDIPEGATFEEAYAAFFAPLTAWEKENGTEWKKNGHSQDEILALVDLTPDMDLGRFHRAYFDTTLEDGPYVVIHTRNGGGNRDHWESTDDATPGKDCPCPGCVQRYRIPQLPNFVFDEDDEFDCTYANSYFKIPGDRVNRLLQELDLGFLAMYRKLVAAGRPPWIILTDNPSFRMPSRSDRDRAARMKADLESATRRLEEDEHAVAQWGVPANRPAERMLRGVNRRTGQRTNRTLVPAPKPATWSAAHTAFVRAETRHNDRVGKINDLDTALKLDLPASVVELLTKELQGLKKYLPLYEADLQVATDDVNRYLYDIVGTLQQRRERLPERQAAQAALERTLDSDWIAWARTWPGTPADLPGMP